MNESFNFSSMVIQKPRKKTGKKYRGFLDTFGIILKEEGPYALFKGLIPNLLQGIISRITRSAIPIFIERAFGIDPESFVFVLLELILGNCELLLTLPLETVKTRLQAQSSSKVLQVPFETVIDTNKIVYTGTIDCLQRIIEEEGVWALYKGWGVHSLSNFLLGILSLLSSIEVEVLDDDFEEPDSLEHTSKS